MQVFEQTITVTKSDLDQLNHVNNVRYVQWVQDIAQTHWLNKATQAIIDSYFWVLVSHHIEYKLPAFLGDALLLRTYVSKSEGVTSLRHVEILNASTNKIIVLSKTKWCLIHRKTERPSRITDEIKTLFD